MPPFSSRNPATTDDDVGRGSRPLARLAPAVFRSSRLARIHSLDEPRNPTQVRSKGRLRLIRSWMRLKAKSDGLNYTGDVLQQQLDYDMCTRIPHVCYAPPVGKGTVSVAFVCQSVCPSLRRVRSE